MTGEIERIAAEVERLEGPSREMDVEIARAVGLGETGYGDSDWTAKPHTASLDAAMTLVPEGWEWAYLDGRAIVREPKSLTHGFGEAATPALALCAAALKARAHLEQHHAKD